jgi:hypothetical protein
MALVHAVGWERVYDYRELQRLRIGLLDLI